MKDQVSKSRTASEAKRALHRQASPRRAVGAARFFKTGQGEYGEGDRFIGVTVPEVRLVARAFQTLKFSEVKKLLRSPIHEERLLALLMLNIKMEKKEERQKIYKFYLSHFKFVNNWDLVDSSAASIAGRYLFETMSLAQAEAQLLKWAKSTHLWTRRIAVVATHFFIRQNQFRPIHKVSTLLLQDREDLIHKAVGWMLREAGKRNEAAHLLYLEKYAHKMPRTMLRYALERVGPKDRLRFMNWPPSNLKGSGS